MERTSFTLLELIIVVMIVAILAGLGIPQYIATNERFRASEGVNCLGALRQAQIRYYLEHSNYVSDVNCTGLDVGADASNLRYFSSASCAGTNSAGAVILARANVAVPYTLRMDTNGDVLCSNAGGTADPPCPRGLTQVSGF